MSAQYRAELGRAIKARREELGLTQKQLAERAHYKEAQSVSRWERGENLPSDLDVVATALETTLHALVAGVTPPNQRVARQLGIVKEEERRGAPDLIGQLNGSDALARLERIEVAIEDLSTGSRVERLERIEAALETLARRQELYVLAMTDVTTRLEQIQKLTEQLAQDAISAIVHAGPESPPAPTAAGEGHRRSAA